jgi:Recombination endonuclease VII
MGHAVKVDACYIGKRWPRRRWTRPGAVTATWTEAAMRKTLAERFAEHTRPEPETGCLLWTGSLHECGSGQIMLSASDSPTGKTGPVLVQRAAFFMYNGRWAQPYALQKCQVKLCVAREHLVEGRRGSTGTPIGERPCRKCGATDRNPKGNCRVCHVTRENARYHSDKPARRARDRARLYGLTESEQDALFVSQDGKCACCGDPIEQYDRHTSLDHDHRTGKVRGFTCRYCNLAVGVVRDSPERARLLAQYLDRHSLEREQDQRPSM